MGKRSKRILVIATVLLYQLSFVSIASAGFFDWLMGEKSNFILLKTSDENRVANNTDIWNDINRKIDQEKTEAKFKVVKTHTLRATGYSSTPDQTDSTPFITASGTYVRDGIVAANFYLNGRRVPFGTMVRIPEIYGEKVFVVEDRMNARYTNNIDIWFPERELAKNFGSKRVTIEIVEES